MFRAVIEVNKYSRQGWDNYHDVYLVDVEASTKAKVKQLAEEEIEKINSDKGYGDWGMILDYKEAKLLRIEKYSVVE